MARDAKIEVKTKDGAVSGGVFLPASATSISLREKSGERAIAMADVAHVRVYDAGRRVRQGLLWTAVGAGAGAGIGVAACPGCANEGQRAKYVGPGVAVGVAVGAAVGAAGFLSSPYRTVYRDR